MAVNEKGVFEMNMNTRAPIKNAAGLTAAGEKKLHNGTYSKPARLSNLKILIGEILLFGNKQRKEFWWLFDSKVRQFYELKMYEGMQ